MKIQAINTLCCVNQCKTVNVKTNNLHSQANSNQPVFRGFKFGDYVAGAYMAGVIGTIASTALTPIVGVPVGLLAGALSAKINNDTRKD